MRRQIVFDHLKGNLIFHIYCFCHFRRVLQYSVGTSQFRIFMWTPIFMTFGIWATCITCTLKTNASGSTKTVVSLYRSKYMTTCPSKLSQAVTLLTCILEASDSNLVMHTDFSDWGFSLFSSHPPGKCRDICWNRPRSFPSTSYQIHSWTLIFDGM